MLREALSPYSTPLTHPVTAAQDGGTSSNHDATCGTSASTVDQCRATTRLPASDVAILQRGGDNSAGRELLDVPASNDVVASVERHTSSFASMLRIVKDDSAATATPSNTNAKVSAHGTGASDNSSLPSSWSWLQAAQWVLQNSLDVNNRVEPLSTADPSLDEQPSTVVIGGDEAGAIKEARVTTTTTTSSTETCNLVSIS